MKRLNITLPDDVYHLLVTHIGKGSISSYLAGLAKQDLAGKKRKLEEAYKKASDDPERKQISEDWDFLKDDLE